MKTTTGAILAGAALAAMLPASAAWAACEPMELESVAGTHEAYFADIDGSGGTSPGDKRAGTRQLHDGDGTPVGNQYWINTVAAVDADGAPTTLAVETLFAFDDGTLFAARTHEPSGQPFEAPKSVTIPPDATFTIHGGTGAYAGATGTLDLTIADGEAAYVFDIACE